MSATPLISFSRPVLFLADLHLGGSKRATERFERLLGRLSRETVVIGLGDIVDFWVEGEDFDLSESYRVLEGLRKFETYFVAGNRDFLAGPRWEKLTGGKMRGDRMELRVFDRRIVALHGDTLVRGDLRYRLWRRVARSHLFARLAGHAGAARARIWADKLRRQSEKEISRKREDTMRLTPFAVRRELARGFDLLVCGHVHRPERTFYPEGEVVVMGPWDEAAEVLLVTEEGTRFTSVDLL